MILLLGDYSSVHYELSQALREKGEDVVLMSDGDSYKNIKSDVELPRLKRSRFKLVNRVLLILRFTGAFGLANYYSVKNEIDKIGGIDVVQIINPVVIPSLGGLGNILLIGYLKRKARVLSLCALGDDYNWVTACLSKRFKYSAMDRVGYAGFKGFISGLYALKYVYSPLYRFLDFYARKKASVVVPGLSDYEIAYANCVKAAELINLPVATDNFQEPSATQYPIKIFHAWQKGKENRKGNDVFDRVINRYIHEHGVEKIQYEIISNVTYVEYLERYKESDIILDQLYSYDRGVTGALGMAAGKVVFSGFEEGHFEIGINATPDEDQLYHDLVNLVNSLELVDAIKRNAYEYAVKSYKADLVCERYLEVWSSR